MYHFIISIHIYFIVVVKSMLNKILIHVSCSIHCWFSRPPRNSICMAFDDFQVTQNVSFRNTVNSIIRELLTLTLQVSPGGLDFQFQWWSPLGLHFGPLHFRHYISKFLLPIRFRNSCFHFSDLIIRDLAIHTSTSRRPYFEFPTWRVRYCECRKPADHQNERIGTRKWLRIASGTNFSTSVEAWYLPEPMIYES